MDAHLEDFKEYIKVVFAALVTYGPKLLLAIIVLFVGLKLINLLSKIIHNALAKTNIDPTIRPYIDSLVIWLLRIILFISVASMIGIETTSLVAVLGAAGLAIGLALQGTLTNFAGGILILTFKPFRHHHLIEVADVLGFVEEIKLFYTHIVTLDNKEVIIPNSKISNEVMVNWSDKGKVRLEVPVGIAYGADIKKAREVILNALVGHENLLKDPEPYVGVKELADSAVVLTVRPWCKPEDYFKTYFSVLEACKIALDENKITIPFPQRDVHLFADKQLITQLKGGNNGMKE